MAIDYTQFFQKWFDIDHPINAVKASADIGSGDDGTVTVEYDYVGTEGNDYSIVVSDANTGEDDVDLTVDFADDVITVNLGTDPDLNSYATIGSGANGTVTVEVDPTDVDENNYTIEVVHGEDGGDLSASLVGEDITVTLGMTDSTSATATIGSGEHGTVNISTVATGSDANDCTVVVDADITGENRELSAYQPSPTELVVNLAVEGVTKASADIGSGDDGTVSLEIDEAGAEGNSYTVEVVQGSDVLDIGIDQYTILVTLGLAGNTANDIVSTFNNSHGDIITATASGDGTGNVAVETIKSFEGGTSRLLTTANTATLIANAINTTMDFTAIASGTGEDSLTEAVSATNFEGGLDFTTDDAKNIATLVAVELNTLEGITATAHGTGDDPLTQIEEEKLFTGGNDSGDISPTKNTATLIAQAISELDNFTATASGDGSTSITVAEEEQEFTGGQYATESMTSGFIIIDDVWYVCDEPVTKYTENGWYSGTPELIS